MVSIWLNHSFTHNNYKSKLWEAPPRQMTTQSKSSVLSSNRTSKEACRHPRTSTQPKSWRIQASERVSKLTRGEPERSPNKTLNRLDSRSLKEPRSRCKPSETISWWISRPWSSKELTATSSTFVSLLSRWLTTVSWPYTSSQMKNSSNRENKSWPWNSRQHVRTSFPARCLSSLARGSNSRAMWISITTHGRRRRPGLRTATGPSWFIRIVGTTLTQAWGTDKCCTVTWIRVLVPSAWTDVSSLLRWACTLWTRPTESTRIGRTGKRAKSALFVWLTARTRLPGLASTSLYATLALK